MTPTTNDDHDNDYFEIVNGVRMSTPLAGIRRATENDDGIAWFQLRDAVVVAEFTADEIAVVPKAKPCPHVGWNAEVQNNEGCVLPAGHEGPHRPAPLGDAANRAAIAAFLRRCPMLRGKARNALELRFESNHIVDALSPRLREALLDVFAWEDAMRDYLSDLEQVLTGKLTLADVATNAYPTHDALRPKPRGNVILPDADEPPKLSEHLAGEPDGLWPYGAVLTGADAERYTCKSCGARWYATALAAQRFPLGRTEFHEDGCRFFDGGYTELESRINDIERRLTAVERIAGIEGP